MKKILLVCSAGMSTNLLVAHMLEAASELNEEIDIIALPSSVIESEIDSVDVVLLSPQVRFQRAKIEELVSQRKGGPVPIGLIDMKNYSNMNGKAVFEAAMDLLK